MFFNSGLHRATRLGVQLEINLTQQSDLLLLLFVLNERRIPSDSKKHFPEETHQQNGRFIEMKTFDQCSELSKIESISIN
jgi:hypothetical protein